MSMTAQKSNQICPCENDVICGKALGRTMHPGNINLRELILSKVPDYMSATSMYERRQIVISILSTVEGNGGRVLKFDKSSEQWYVIPAAYAREKVSHQMRDRVRERKLGKVVRLNSGIGKSPQCNDESFNDETSCKMSDEK